MSGLFGVARKNSTSQHTPQMQHAKNAEPTPTLVKASSNATAAATTTASATEAVTAPAPASASPPPAAASVQPPPAARAAGKKGDIRAYMTSSSAAASASSPSSAAAASASPTSEPASMVPMQRSPHQPELKSQTKSQSHPASVQHFVPIKRPALAAAAASPAAAAPAAPAVEVVDSLFVSIVTTTMAAATMDRPIIVQAAQDDQSMSAPSTPRRLSPPIAASSTTAAIPDLESEEAAAMDADLISPLPSPMASPPRPGTAAAAAAASSGYVTPPRSARRSSAVHTPPYSSRPLSYGPEAFSPPTSGRGHARAASVGGPFAHSPSPSSSPVDVRYLSRLVSPARDLGAAVRGSAKRAHARTFSFGLNGVTSESLLSSSPHSSSVRASPASPWSTASSNSESESPLSMTPNLHALREVHAGLECSDRFIPSRRGSNLEHAAYGTLAEEDRSMQENVSSSGMAITFTNSSHPSAAASQAASAAAIGNSLGSNGAFSNAYGLLLRSEILGDKHGQSTGNTAVSACGEKQLVNAQLIMHRPGGASPIVGSGAAAAAASSPASSSSASTGSGNVKDSPRSPFPQTFRFSSPRAPSTPSEPNWTTSLSNSGLGVSSETARLLARMKTPSRVISKLPHKVLDAPGIKDDFYLNLMDWSSQNVVAVALGASVYCWYGATGKVSKLCDLDETKEQVTSVTWSQRGNHLAVGLRSGGIQIWDITRSKHVRTLTGHTSRVGTLAWNSHVLASGSRDRSILLHDPRAASVGGSSSSRASSSNGSVVGKFLGHKQEVCGMKWSPDQQQLASGGNDNKLLIWSAHAAGAASAQGGAPLHRFDQHQAAVKAIAWSPHQHGLLCSGGGTADRCIRFWNTQLGQPISHIDTGSQVCNLLWSKNCNEIVSTHGYSLNQIIAWKYPTMQQITTLVGHTMRVLYLAVSPCGQTILTGAGDETLRFWNLFPNSESKAGVGPSSSLVLPTTETLLR